MITLPTAPWKEVAVDFAGLFPSRDYIVVVVDEFSRFPEVELLTSTSAKAVVPKLDAIFSRLGVPDILKSDNGHEFKTFADYVGFKRRLVQTLEKNIRTAHIEGKNWKQNWETPHSTTHVSPCKALNSRKLKTWLPETPTTRYKQQQSMFQDP